MAYNIEISSEKQFSVNPDSTGLLLPWKFNPKSALKVNHVIGSALPVPVDIATVIKNYASLAEFEAVVVRAQLILNNGNTIWATLSGEIFNDTPAAPISPFDKTGYTVETDNLNVTNTLTFTNVDVLTSGVYSGVIRFTAHHVSVLSSIPELIESIDYNFELNVSTLAQTSADKDTLVFDVLRNDNLPEAQTVTITSGNLWKARIDSNFEITGPGVVDNSNTDFTIVAATGVKAIEVALKDSIHQYPGDTLQTQLVIKDVTATIYIDVTVNIISNNELTITPESLDFYAVKGFTEADPQDFTIAGFGFYILSGPSWINLSSNSGNNTTTFTATPLSANNLEPGIYTHDILVYLGGEIYGVLPVTYTVEGSVSTPLNKGNINFAKELEYINVLNNNRDADNYVNAILNVSVVNYKSFSRESFQFSYALPFFKHQLKWHIGEIIERLFVKPKSITDFSIEKLSIPNKVSLPVFDVANVSAKIQIIKRSSGDIVSEENLVNMSFLPGTKPLDFQNNMGFLASSNNLKRVTVNSYELAAFFVPSGIYKLSVIQNNKVIYSVNETAIVKVKQHLLNFSSFKAGDTIDVELLVETQEANTDATNKFETTIPGETVTNTFKKSYYITPLCNHSYHIAFVNRNNVLEFFECTGRLVLGNDIKHISHTYYNDFLNYTENLESDEEKSIRVNTGFIFKNNLPYINAILRSKIAWLVFKDKPAIALAPKNKKLSEYDSDQELYDYELEFTLNKSKDVEDYSF